MEWKKIPKKDRVFVIGLIWLILFTIVFCIIWFGQKK
jgi:hypothetical protein